ncbi:double-strand break repair helicase AddA [Oryzibacter oryziterrae]|uniref:double-strand break repair helicase AddA n=1 Tax=Oryzibacter oryziterrae TaxID=2766474 RepID=UPI001F00E433|nr:double-strand break repair helicase AddA [Oryzibacter oryziterrae]
MKIPQHTRENQARATDPRASAFVSANAGSGKTFVLTRRVIRLLLDGADPGRILCLTFTKAAAAEMANRVFEELGRWATLDDATLAKVVTDIEEGRADGARLEQARQLFARALETPGGLKVQTIHAFAEALLQRFALEANLDGRFTVLDDVAAADLYAEAKSELTATVAADPEGALARAFRTMVRLVSDQGLDGVLKAMIAEREAFGDWIRAEGDLATALAALPARLGAPAGVTCSGVLASYAAAPGFPGTTLSPLIDVLDRASKTMQDMANGFRAALVAPSDAARRLIWRAIFLTKDLEPKKRAFTKEVEKHLPDANERFAREAQRLVELEQLLTILDTVERTAALALVADRMIGLIQANKARRGALDFNDLIERAAALLSRSDAAAWVQYKLDEGLDHVLVDEAQDTSPRQWQIIEALTGDFHAGEGARAERNRTIFAVGDEKQSIYSFQGAAPHLFGHARRTFGDRLRGARKVVHDLSLTLSFRSTAAVVGAVDKVFQSPMAHAGLSTEAGPTVHETVRAREPGLVELWPEIERQEQARSDDWHAPVDQASSGSPQVQLANRIAGEIAGWFQREERLPATGARIRPGDVLILVRKRGPFVDAVNRALKLRGVAVAGADRLDVIGHIITQDLLAAARVALLPDDDLALATVARSPLIGLDDDALLDLAHGRKGRLWTAVRAAADAGLEGAKALQARVSGWMRHSDRGEPYDFFARIVGPEGARATYRARFGREADEVIDEFLSLVITYEGQEAAGLHGFIDRLQKGGEKIKRELDASRDEVRVMTVHGSKGLEAPVVFLVDPGDAPASGHNLPTVLRLEGERAPLIWPAAGAKPEPVAAAGEHFLRAQEEEYRRLLYVGLTRARDRLIVAGIRRFEKGSEQRWHGLVSAALRGEAEEVMAADGSVAAWRWRAAQEEPPAPPRAESLNVSPPAALPDWLFTPVDATLETRAVRPSSAWSEGQAEEEEDQPSEASVRGTALHRLLELLPEVAPTERRAQALAFVERQLPDLAAEERESLVAQVIAILDAPELTALFSAGSRAEAAVSGTIRAGGRRISVSGQIDRMAVTPDEVLIVDYKTSRMPPRRIPDAYLLQLALYRAVLADLWPGRRITAGILWTEVARFDPAAADDLDRSLAAYLASEAEKPVDK